MFFHGFPLREKLRTRTSFSKLLANYTSEESLINAVYDKNIIQVSFNVIVCIKSKFQMSVKSVPRLCFYSTSLCNWCTKLASFSRPIRFNARVNPRYRVEAIYHRYIKIPIWLRGGIKQRNHIEIEGWITNFFCLIPLSLGAMLEFWYIEKGLFACFYSEFSLVPGDIFLRSDWLWWLLWFRSYDIQSKSTLLMIANPVSGIVFQQFDNNRKINRFVLYFFADF